MKWKNNNCRNCTHSVRFSGSDKDWCRRYLPPQPIENNDNKCPHYKFQNAFSVKYEGENSVIAILRRLWFVISNPFIYILFGRTRI